MSSPSSSPTADTLSTASKRVRTSKPKVRSGCITCKARRIKCDEVKPFCDRCTKFGRKCGGYKVQLTSEERSATRHEQSLILPKVEPQVSVLPTPNVNIPLSPEQIFCIDTSLQLCRILDSPVWSPLKLEVCRQNPFIGNALSAIRILSKGSPPDEDCIDPQIAGGHHGLSLLPFHQDRFLEGSRASLATGSGAQSPSVASLICLMTVCLDTLHFQHTPALAHIQVGLTLIAQILPSHNGSLGDEVIRAFRMLEAKAAFLDPLFPFYLPMALSLGSPFVLPPLICAPADEVSGELFGFEDDAESFYSRGSSVAGVTP